MSAEPDVVQVVGDCCEVDNINAIALSIFKATKVCGDFRPIFCFLASSMRQVADAEFGRSHHLLVPHRSIGDHLQTT